METVFQHDNKGWELSYLRRGFANNTDPYEVAADHVKEAHGPPFAQSSVTEGACESLPAHVSRGRPCRNLDRPTKLLVLLSPLQTCSFRTTACLNIDHHVFSLRGR